MASVSVTSALCYGAALAATLVLAAWLTPRRWWRRPNLQALAVVGGGTAAIGTLFVALAGAPDAATAAAAAGNPATPATPATVAPTAPRQTPAPGARYRVAWPLNLRRDGGVGAPRVAVLPAGLVVVATGQAQGDWWQIRARVGGRAVDGWASSLWLRRTDEVEPAPLE